MVKRDTPPRMMEYISLVGVGCAGLPMKDLGTSFRKFYEAQTKEAILLASDLLSGPSKWDQHLRRAAALASGTLYLSSTIPLPSSLQKSLLSKQLTILASAFLRLLSWVLTRFNFSHGCNISVAGESPQ
jgi:hypothetical protein